MACAFGIYTSDPNLLRCELGRLRDEVILAGTNEALGAGWYADENVLLQRYSAKARPESIEQLGGVLESDALIVHSDALALGMSLEENTQPFRYRQWLFASHGGVIPPEKFRARALDVLPDHIARCVRGATSQEIAFALMLAALREIGRTDDTSLEPSIAARALGQAARRAEALAQEVGARPPAMAMIATNAQVMIAARLGEQPMFFRLLEGVATCEVCGLKDTPDSQARVRSHMRRKSVVIATNIRDPQGWIPVDSGAAIGVGRTLHVETIGF
ncbi:MAG: class II glutamine amidotransferase [Myxococcaceae bacterium]|nr:class II glutamine amidotransferase [Myxococcaceae bacterium]